jgi:hypothetical protein
MIDDGACGTLGMTRGALKHFGDGAARPGVPRMMAAGLRCRWQRDHCNRSGGREHCDVLEHYVRLPNYFRLDMTFQMKLCGCTAPSFMARISLRGSSRTQLCLIVNNLHRH